MSRKTIFKYDWLEEPAFQCFRAVPNSTQSVHYTLCYRTIDLSNMGRRALSSHVEGKKHKQRVSAKEGSYAFPVFCATKTEVVHPIQPQVDVPIKDLGNLQGVTESALQQKPEASTSTNSIGDKVSHMHGLESYLFKDDVMKAEILWCLTSLMNHVSLSAAGKAVDVFRNMFPDSKIASQMKLGRAKMSYNIVFGLAPYFHQDMLVDDIVQSKYFFVCFDESLNKLAQLQQMDIAVRFWSTKCNKVTTRYFSSAFLGHTRAADLLTAFKSELSCFDLKCLLHISMDGPNVNLKFVNELKALLVSKHDEDDPSFLMMGSCGLHVMNNAFKKGESDTGGKIVIFLRCLYNVFKDVPARRSDYTYYSGSTLLPKKYCAVRWLENADVAERAIKILPNVSKCVDGMKRDGKKVTFNSYTTMCDSLNDKLLAAKLAFFAHIARILEPFIREFQNDAPMAPFLYTDLTNIITELMSLFVKQEVIKKASSVDKVDLEKPENLVLFKYMNLGYSVRAQLRKHNISDLELMTFKKDCRVMLTALLNKLLEKSPIKYKLCKGLSFCDPSLLCNFPEFGIKRLGLTLQVFQESKWLSGNECDALEKEFKTLIAKPEVKILLNDFKRSTRLDHLWNLVLTSSEASSLLVSFIQKTLIISHGNAFVERGFSLNKEIVIENQLPRSLVAQHQVYDGVQALGGLEHLEITRKMNFRVKNSRMLYSKALEDTKKECEKKEQESLARKRLCDQVKELKEKKLKLQHDRQKEMDAIDEEILSLCGNSVKI